MPQRSSTERLLRWLIFLCLSLSFIINTHTRFPGILPNDDILSLLQLFASKNPTGEIAAKILLNGGYDPCSKFPENSTFWTINNACDAGFIPDFKNKYCYILLPDKENIETGADYCKNSYYSELVTFDSNSEVDGFKILLSKGKWLSSISNTVYTRV